MRCLVRKGQQCRGHGETIGDCIVTVTPSRTETAYRVPIYSVGYGICAAPEPQAPAQSDVELRPRIQDKFVGVPRMNCAHNDRSRESSELWRHRGTGPLPIGGSKGREEILMGVVFIRRESPRVRSPIQLVPELVTLG